MAHTSLVSLFTDIADAIRAKTGSSAQIVADDFPDAIASISTGGKQGTAGATGDGTQTISFQVDAEPIAWYIQSSHLKKISGYSQIISVFYPVKDMGDIRLAFCRLNDADSPGNDVTVSMRSNSGIYTYDSNNGTVTIDAGSSIFTNGKYYVFCYVYN